MKRRLISVVVDENTVTPEGERVWTCGTCGKRMVWGPGWRWFGRYGGRRSHQEEIIERVACSAECAGTDTVIA